MARKTPKHKAKRTSTKPAKKSGKLKKATKISFDYIKSNQFRVVHVDGAHGGIAPSGHTIQMALFSERAPIPKRETYKLEASVLGDRIARVERDAIIREVEIEALMDLNTAKRIVGWLEAKIHAAEELQKELIKK